MSADDVFYEAGNVRITAKRATIGGADYPIASLSSVRVKPGGRTRAEGIALLVGSAVALALGIRTSSPCLGLGGAAFLVVGFVALFATRPSVLYIATMGRELEALRGSPPVIDAIANALRRAIDERP